MNHHETSSSSHRSFRAVQAGIELLAVLSLTIGMLTVARAESPEPKKAVAKLGLPQASPPESGQKIIRASGEQPSEEPMIESIPILEEVKPTVEETKPVPKVPRTSYPTPYSKLRREPVAEGVGNLWKKMIGDGSSTSASTTNDPKATYQYPGRATPPVPSTTAPKSTPEPPTAPAPLISQGKTLEAVPSEPLKKEPERKIISAIRKVSEPIVPATKVVPAPQPTTTVNVVAPAWKWYGYGTITPGNKPATSDGTYPLASAGWLQQSRATPGAIPQGFLAQPTSTTLLDAPPIHDQEERIERMPLGNAEPISVLLPPEEPVVAEIPPLRTPVKIESVPTIQAPQPKEDPEPEPEFILPPPLPPTGTPVTQRDPRGGTMIYFPVPTANPITPATPKASMKGIILPPTGMPISQRPGANPSMASRPQADSRTLARGQAPSPEKSELMEKIQGVATAAKNLAVKQVAPNRLTLSFSVSKQTEVEEVANRISALPELAKFYLDFEIKVH